MTPTIPNRQALFFLYLFIFVLENQIKRCCSQSQERTGLREAASALACAYDGRQNPGERETLAEMDPRPLFNADVTGLNRKRERPGWVAVPASKQPIIVTTGYSGNHVSHFYWFLLVVRWYDSFPFPIIHGNPIKFRDMVKNEYTKRYLVPRVIWSNSHSKRSWMMFLCCI